MFYENKGVLNRKGKAGSNEESFSGRIGTKRLKVGRYRIVVTATDAAGNASQPKTKAFRIVG